MDIIFDFHKYYLPDFLGYLSHIKEGRFLVNI